MKGLGSTEMGVAHILKIEGNKLAAINAESQQFLFDQVQHDRLSAAADAGEDFDQFIPHERGGCVSYRVPVESWVQPPLCCSAYHKYIRIAIKYS